MAFSIKKLEKFLRQKEFTIITYYILDEYIVYIKVLGMQSFNQYIIYIPSKYEIKIENISLINDSIDVHRLKSIDLSTEINTGSNNILENYTSAAEKDEQIDRIYGNINIFSIPTESEELETNLIENYDQPIVLKNLTKYRSQNDIKNIINQLTRLRNCTKNIRYKLSIFYKNYIYSISRNDEIDTYILENYTGMDKRQIFVILDLEILYSKNTDDIHFDLKNVQEQIFKVLNQNQVNNITLLNNMMKKDILSHSNDINNKIENMSKHVSELQNMLTKLKESEKIIIAKIDTINDDYEIKRDFHSDVEKTHKINSLERELHGIDKLMTKVNNNLQELKIHQDDLILRTDQIIFDNSIMIHSIINNFEKM